MSVRKPRLSDPGRSPGVRQIVACFSAVAYFFRKELHERLRIPIGLIQTCWGGSAAEVWTKKEKLLEFVEFKYRVLQLDSLEATTEKLQAKYEKE